ncbi:MAG: rod shape-determining protein RodA [Clostridia bacterium]|nr:rod shape-determining protein RodA [Clostridia bacterium]
MRRQELKNMEWTILICAIVLAGIGLIALYSVSFNTEFSELKKQAIWLGISIVAMFIVVIIDYDVIAKVSPIWYVFFCILLVGVLFTVPVDGASRWFNLGAFTFQPAEFSKVFVILFTAYVMSKIQENGMYKINKIGWLLLVLLVAAVPIALVIKEPDHGTAMAYITAVLFMLFTAGIDKKYIITVVILGIISVPLLYNYVLPDYAKTRIDVFLNPELDPRGSGYNIIQSKLAVGAGELLGMGLLQGNQTQLGYLYPKTTDFIFAAIGEELGFIVTALIVILYVFLITKAVYVAKTARDNLGSYIAIGIAGIFFFHMAENIGMTIGLMPISGIPLPFISYGGSSLITSFVCVGLLLNISSKRQKTIFVNK